MKVTLENKEHNTKAELQLREDIIQPGVYKDLKKHLCKCGGKCGCQELGHTHSSRIMFALVGIHRGKHMDLSGKKILIRNEEESRKVQYLLFLFGYCWWSMRSDRGWKHNDINYYPSYIYMNSNSEKTLMYCEEEMSAVKDLVEVTIDQLINTRS